MKYSFAENKDNILLALSVGRLCQERTNALNGLIDIVGQAGAALVGAGICIEKAYQGGGDAIRARGIRVESLAKIASMSEERGVVFCE